MTTDRSFIDILIDILKDIIDILTDPDTVIVIIILGMVAALRRMGPVRADPNPR